MPKLSEELNAREQKVFIMREMGYMCLCDLITK